MPHSHLHADPAPHAHLHPARFPVTVDVVALTVGGGELRVLLINRLIEPFKGGLALPGGFVLPGEGLRDAAARELAEETGVARLPGHLEQLQSYGPAGRDPRGDVLTVAHLLLAPDFPVLAAGSDAAHAGWHPVSDVLDGVLDVAFDHRQIIADAVERARSKLEYSPLGAAFCGEEFTVAQLRAVYEAVWGTRLDPRNFHRKATGTPGFLEDTGAMSAGEAGRPAALFRLAPESRFVAGEPVRAVLNPPLMRPRG
ncbi:8-oxo-dGTP diphosphatase [Arthrobacter stackebrandtii]|uniref:8-oxo-dGTP diphosphatase n=1 Tax=Arthrobacter stackebrandtii TaxID=272161 RepID=A0ABS4YSV5_9MICC|nr:NUDIX domain-containing protein [Arthrobacter stackebrandtii]MBP2411877.1 8-oxo-dGTP diphosphatase [Arthrobacter stackebrandtii]PYG99095.1 NUDIX hydrolase [Arthrobacter stackebrandtii]